MYKLFTPFSANDGLKILTVTQAIAFLFIWFVFPSKVIPDPLEILRAWHVLAAQQGLLVELFNSAKTITIAILLSTIITLVITCLSTMRFFKPVAQWLTALRFLGFAGITFVFTLWTNSGAELKIWLLTFGMTAFLLTNVLAMVNEELEHQENIDYCKSLHLPKWRIVYEILIRGKIDDILDLVRQNAAIGWTLLSLVEGLVRSEGGIGALLLNHSRHLHLSSIAAIQLTILLYGVTQDISLRYIRRLVCPWIK
jgi:ABC-type nitrate/sulfonate/bicarbonate transport system permease component